MLIKKITSRLLLVSIVFVLGGCKDTLERWFNAETYEFSGHYESQYGNATLWFNDGMVQYTSKQISWRVPYSIDGSLISITIRHSSREKRKDIVMRIHAEGELLTCSACAKHQMSNIWTRLNSEVRNKVSAEPL